MGIDVYTTDLAHHLRDYAVSSRSPIGRLVQPLVAATRPKPADAAATANRRPMGPIRSYLCARELVQALDLEHLRPGNPFAALGEAWMMEPDRMDAGAWLALHARLADETSRLAHDGAPLPVWHAAWDDLPGVAFARAVEAANSLIVPAQRALSGWAERIAIASTHDGGVFLDVCAQLLSVERAALTPEYEGETNEELGRLLYNLRLFSHHLRQANDTRRPIGIWG